MLCVAMYASDAEVLGQGIPVENLLTGRQVPFLLHFSRFLVLRSSISGTMWQATVGTRRNFRAASVCVTGALSTWATWHVTRNSMLWLRAVMRTGL